MRLKRVLGASVPVFLVLSVLPLGVTPATAKGTEARAAVKVDRKLLRQLGKGTGGVAAVITARNRAGLAAIERLGVRGTKLRTLPMILTRSLTLGQLNGLKRSAAVRSVWANRKYDLLMEDTTWITKARYVWPTSNGPGGPQGFGVTGAGVELAIIDTGFDGKHEDGDNLIEFCNTTGAASGEREDVVCTPWNIGPDNVPFTSDDLNAGPAGICGATYPGPSNTGPGPTFLPPGCTNKARVDSIDADVAHGSHVGGTMAGSGHASGGMTFTHSTIGMAPHAKLRVYKANIGPALASFEILSAYDDMTYKKLIGYSKVVAVNNSWGGGDGANYDQSDPTMVAVRRAFDAGILSVFAAGNSGPEHDTLSSQCVSPFVVCVAASTKPDSVVMFSSRGRPSQLADTDRDGTAGDSDDIKPDNHDWRLGQALELGRYRPTLAAPGVNINSIKAFAVDIGDPGSAACQEDNLIQMDDAKASCYVAINGTSMATPHVTGAIGLIAQAFRQGHGRMPHPNELIDILERSANRAKLPAWEAEEQGAGRLDAYEAVKFARTYPNGLPRPNIGYSTPPFVNGAYPGGAGSLQPAGNQQTGCTAPLSWSTHSLVEDVQGVPLPPVFGPLSPQYGQHFIEVPERSDRLRITVNWGGHPTANLYLRLWRPGVDPSAEAATPEPPARTSAFHQARVWPDQEAIGLVFIGDERWIDVRAPEETTNSPAPPTIPSGKWVLRVYHRAGGAPTTCDVPTPTQENPKNVTGYRYTVKTEIGRVTHRPAIDITSPAAGTQTGRFVEIKGKAGYPPPANPAVGNTGRSWEGVTNWEVPGSAQAAGGGIPSPDNRPVLYFHGSSAPHENGVPNEPGCTGNGEADVLPPCSGPYLIAKPELALTPVNVPPTTPNWRTGIDDEVFDGANDRTIHDPNWVWCLVAQPACTAAASPASTPTTVGGPMTVEWWASCNLCSADVGISADWIIRLWADGVLKFEQRVTATPAQAGIPSRLVRTVTIPTFTANRRIVLHVDPVFIDSQTVTFIYYDRRDADNVSCQAAAPSECDSLVRMPVGGTGSTGAGAGPENVRVTDLPAGGDYPSAPTQSPALRVAWDPVSGASAYRVHRSTNPAFVPSSGNRVFSGLGPACPQNESPNTPTDNNPPGEERGPAVCFTDTGVSLLTTYYYRVIAVKSGQLTDKSEIAYGTPTRYDRQVKLKVDRLYGPQYWEYALLPPSPTPSDTTNAGLSWTFLWDTLELIGMHDVFGRSFTQGIGSLKDSLPITLDEDPGPGPEPDPGCPDDDDGDGDDDEDDGDHDDDGDDDDDDCEDDDDHEEEDDD